MTHGSQAEIARRVLTMLVQRLGSRAHELAPILDTQPDRSGNGWERRYAQWWADLYRQASMVLPFDEEIATCAATWATLAEGDTIAMLRRAAALAGRPIGADDLRLLLIAQ